MSHITLSKALSMIESLKSSRFSLKRLADNFDMSERTVYRYLETFEQVGLLVEKDFEGRFFIIEIESTKTPTNHVPQMQELQCCDRDHRRDHAPQELQETKEEM
jgi:Fe2+ or Zn2+ uptake regulation protein